MMLLSFLGTEQAKSKEMSLTHLEQETKVEAEIPFTSATATGAVTSKKGWCREEEMEWRKEEAKEKETATERTQEPLKGNCQGKGPRTFKENNQGEDPNTSFILRPLQGKVVRKIDCETHLAG